MQVSSGGGGGRKPARPKPKPVMHRATLTAFRKPSPISPPPIPKKYAPTPKPSPSRSVLFPQVGTGHRGPGQLAVPVSAGNLQAAIQQAKSRASFPQSKPAAASVYLNPFRAVANLVPGRIDQGVDYGGTGKVYALGPGKITYAGVGNQTGWGPPNNGIAPGGFIAEQLSAGPAKGQTVYVAEGINPTVTTGQTVTAKTVIGNMVNAIETGWGSGSGTGTAASAAGELGGPTSTAYGSAYSRLLHSLGAPAGNPQDPGGASRYLQAPAWSYAPGGKYFPPLTASHAPGGAPLPSPVQLAPAPVMPAPPAPVSPVPGEPGVRRALRRIRPVFTPITGPGPGPVPSPQPPPINPQVPPDIDTRRTNNVQLGRLLASIDQGFAPASVQPGQASQGPATSPAGAGLLIPVLLVGGVALVFFSTRGKGKGKEKQK